MMALSSIIGVFLLYLDFFDNNFVSDGGRFFFIFYLFIHLHLHFSNYRAAP